MTRIELRRKRNHCIHSHFLKQFVFIKPNLHLSFFSLCTHKKAKIQNRVSSGRKQFNPHLFILSDIWESVGAKAKSRPILRDEKFTFASILLCFVMQLFVFFACGSIEESNFLVSVMQQTKRTAASKERKQKKFFCSDCCKGKKGRDWFASYLQAWIREGEKKCLQILICPFSSLSKPIFWLLDVSRVTENERCIFGTFVVSESHI